MTSNHIKKITSFPEIEKSLHTSLQDEFEEIITNWGHDMLFRRTDPDKKCSCTKNGSYDPKCPRCMRGLTYQDEVIKAFPVRGKIHVTENEIITELGAIDNYDQSFLLSGDVKPADKDYILEISLDSKGNAIRPIKILKLFKSQFDPQSFRDDDGRIAFWVFPANKIEWSG